MAGLQAAGANKIFRAARRPRPCGACWDCCGARNTGAHTRASGRGNGGWHAAAPPSLRLHEDCRTLSIVAGRTNAGDPCRSRNTGSSKALCHESKAPRWVTTPWQYVN